MLYRQASLAVGTQGRGMPPVQCAQWLRALHGLSALGAKRGHTGAGHLRILRGQHPRDAHSADALALVHDGDAAFE